VIMPPKTKKRAGKGKKRPVEDVESENMQEDDEMFNVQNEAMGGGNEQEDLTQEEKDSVHLKKLTTNNPQAASNTTTFSFAERIFKQETSVEQIVFHYSVDGDIIMKETSEANDQQDYIETKLRQEKDLLHSINASIIQQFGSDPLAEDKVA